MIPARLELSPGLWLDARRAVYLAESATLAVADLHLGYAWAHRHGGQLLPLQLRDESTARLLALAGDYAPREIVLLGDIVHRAVPVPELRAEVRDLCAALSARAPLRLLAGNHDARLAEFAGCEVLTRWTAGPHLLLHGDERAADAAASHLQAAAERGGRIIFGHEHPAITLSDRVATRAKCPCFLAAPNALVLPAFSPWAAGTEVRDRQFLSAYSHAAEFSHAIAILAGKLLPVPLR